MVIKPVINDNLVLALSMNEGTGTVAYDISGNSNDGTITGATWEKNNFGGNYDLNFAASTNSINVGQDSSLDIGTQDFTIVTYIDNLTSPTNSPRLIDKISSISGLGFLISFDSSGYIVLGLQDSGGYTGYNFNAANGNSSFTGVSNVHIVLSVDRNGNATLYKNGKIDGSAIDVSGSNGSITRAVDCIIGNRAGTANTGINAKIYYLNQYNGKALSAEEIKAIHNNTYRV